MEVKFLFWNLKNLPRAAIVAHAVRSMGVHVLILVECSLSRESVLEALVGAGCAGFEAAPRSEDMGDIHLFLRIPGLRIRPLHNDPYHHLSVHELRIDRHPAFVLAILHSQSKRAFSDDDQLQITIRRAQTIKGLESEPPRTILVGDLNMNPFEKGVVGSEGFHAVMTKEIAAGGNRTVDAVARPYFYNPMWRFFGEREDAPPGSYFYAAHGKPVAYFWNIFDQVLLRPAMMRQLKQVAIIDRVDGLSLLTPSGIPSLEVGSDHLPLTFTMDF